MADNQTTPSWRGVEQTARREEWFGEIQEFLEARMADAPDETCRLLARMFVESAHRVLDEAARKDACA